jgi:hypothetical protein
MNAPTREGIERVVTLVVVGFGVLMTLSAGAQWTFSKEIAMSALDSKKASVLREVLKKFSTGEKIEPAEFQDFVKAQNDGATIGIKVGERIPDFTLPDQNGTKRGFRDLTARSGLLLVFSRSADW